MHKILGVLIGLMSYSEAFIFKNKNVVKTPSRQTEIISSSTSCAPSKWANQIQNACLCCLVKHAPKPPISKTKADSVLKQCAKYCNESALTGLSQHFKVSQRDSAAFMTKVMHEGAGLKVLDMQSQSGLFEQNGNLTTDAVVQLLTEAKKQEIVSFQGKLVAKKLGGGGAKTLQLFLISENKKPRYILKGMATPETEVKNLTDIRNSRLREYIMDPARPAVRGEPVLAMDVENFIYLVNGQRKHVSLINLAQGKAVSDIIFGWGKGDVRTETVQMALRRLGDNIGKIHNHFTNGSGKTYIHGDMHPQNVFYDATHDRIIFIDNETFAESIRTPLDPSIDIIKFYGNLVASFFETHAYTKGVDERRFHEVIVKSFVEGYINAAGPEKRNETLQFLYKTMAKQGVFKINRKDRKTVFNPIKLAQSQKNYLIPLFQEMGQIR